MNIKKITSIANYFLFSFFNCCTVLIPATSPDAIDSTYPSTPVICPAKYMFLFSFVQLFGLKTLQKE